MKHYPFLLLIYLFPLSVFAQIGESIPEHRKTNWMDSGYDRNSSDNLPTGSFQIINVSSPTGNPTSDYNNIISAINTASNSSSSGSYVVVKLKAGTYIINNAIELGPNDKYIILRGEGKGQTFIKKGSSSNSSTIIEVKGLESSTKFYISSFNSSDNSITLSSSTASLQAGDYVDIQVPNGSWHNSNNSQETDLLGQVVKIKSKISSTKYILEDDFSFVWNLANSENKTPYFNKLTLVNNIGFEEFTIESLNGNPGHLFYLNYSKNIWVREIESFNAVNSHFHISHSTQIEVRRNYIHHAQNYGVGGHGYGVVLIRRTTNSLVEDNIFQSLRHAMLLASGANRNVFGYNYSREQKDEIGNILSDLNLHGNFPFLNLLEGNRVDRIKADSYHGSNGHYNTLVRNYTYYRKLKVSSSDKFNLIGNEAKLVSENSNGHFDEYDNKITHGMWNPADFLRSIHEDISYYHDSKPSFLSAYSWPPIGPRMNTNANLHSHLIPARDRFCNENPSQCENDNIGGYEDIAFFRAFGDSDPTLNRIFIYKSNGSSFSHLTNFSYGGYDFKGITSGDFNRDGIDDIAFYRANGDGNPTLNRIYVYKSNGTSFSYLTNFSYGGYDFKGISAGRFGTGKYGKIIPLTEEDISIKHQISI